MQWLANVSVRRPVLASVLMLAILVVGAAGYAQLGVDKFPKVDFPMVIVTTYQPGAAPSEIESDITDKIEGVVNTVSGIDDLTSISTEGVSMVFVQFDLEKDADVASQEIRDRINTVLSDLPRDARTPQVGKFDPDAAPLLLVSVKAAKPIDQITEVADTKVRRRLESVSGVGQVKVIGGEKRRINVDVDPVRLRAAGVTALEVHAAIASQNVTVPGGRIEAGPDQTVLRFAGRATTPAAIGDIIVRQQGDRPVRVADVATVVDGVEPAESVAVRDGVSSVVLIVRKQSGANSVAVVDAVRAAIEEVKGSLPPGFELAVVRDNSEAIRTSTDSVQEHLVVGAILAAIVVLIFLGSARSTLIAAIAIPISIIGTFGLMWAVGFTMNILTLLALALAVGIVIDDAIVVLENIHRWIEEKGAKPFVAAVKATQEIGLAVLATTLSLLAVFLPVAFMGGIVGRFLMSFGLTMAFAILVSMLVSFTITPMLAARWLKGHGGHAPGGPRQKTFIERLVDTAYLPLERLYVRVLAFVMRHRWVVVLACIAALASIPVLAGKVAKGFLPPNDEAQFEIYLETKPGTSLDATSLVAERVARQTRDVDGVKSTLVTIGDGEQRQSNVAKIYVRLTDPVLRDASQDEIMERIRQGVVAKVPADVNAAVQLVADFSAGSQNAKVAWVIRGPDLLRLEQYGRTALAQLEKVPGVVDASSNLKDPAPEQVARPMWERAADLGVAPGDLIATLQLLVGGTEVSRYEESGEQYEVFVRAGERFRNNPAALQLISVPSRKLGMVPLSDVVTMEPSEGPAQINRLNRQRQVTLFCNVAPGYDESAVVASLQQIVDGLGMPPGYTSEPFGQTKELARTGKAFAFAFLMSFVFMYLVLAAQFESWVHPLVIMLTLPLTLPFALLSVYLFGQQLDIFSMLGLLVLFGVVKKNAILQIDQTNQLRRAGMERTPAILEANRSRLRPILMTTLAFVAGMLPLVFSHGIGAGFSKAMAGIIIGGQSLSLLLTLLAAPVLYSLFDDLSGFAGRMFRKVVKPRTDRGEAELEELNAGVPVGQTIEMEA